MYNNYSIFSDCLWPALTLFLLHWQNTCLIHKVALNQNLSKKCHLAQKRVASSHQLGLALVPDTCWAIWPGRGPTCINHCYHFLYNGQSRVLRVDNGTTDCAMWLLRLCSTVHLIVIWWWAYKDDTLPYVWPSIYQNISLHTGYCYDNYQSHVSKLMLLSLPRDVFRYYIHECSRFKYHTTQCYVARS